MPFVVIVVLNWNKPDDTLACLDSLTALGYSNVHIIVVDNGSTDNSVKRISQAYREVEIIEAKTNLGYAGGNNLGVQYALNCYNPDYIFIANNDVIFDSAALTYLVAAAEDSPQAGFLGPKIYQHNVPQQIQSAGTVVTKWGETYQIGLNEMDNGQFDVQRDVDSLVGCATLIRSDTLRKVGSLDERFYLYREDIDWCLRAKRAGYKILYVPGAKVWHHSSNVREENLPLMQYYMSRNSYMLLYKNAFGWFVIFRMLIKHLIWLINWTVNPKWSHKRKQRNALLKALIDAALGRYGKQTHYFGVNNV